MTNNIGSIITSNTGSEPSSQKQVTETLSVCLKQNAKIKCLVCPKYFQPKRSTAKYCSSACRQIAKRDRDILWQRVHTIEQMIAEIVRTDSAHKLAALQRINRKIKYEVMQATDPGKELIKAIHEYMKA